MALPSPGGQRFVVPTFATKGAVAALDVGGHTVLRKVFVHDGQSEGWSYELEVKGAAIKNLTLFAISPDGQLAVLNDDSVEVFPLPPSQ